jgi:hypothetical protein
MHISALRLARRASCAFVFALAFATAAPAAPFAPANPLPLAERSAPRAEAPIETVQYRQRRHYRNGGGRNWGGDRHWRGDRGWRGNRGWRGDRGWRGGRDYRWNRGYRRYYDDGFYGGTGIYFGLGLPAYRYVDPYVAPRPVYRARRAGSHVEWCYNRYRSYRASDNTFQPYHGPRRQCYSPY